MNKHEKRNAFRRFNNFFVFAFLIFVMLSILRPFESDSELEERYSHKAPELSIETALNGEFKNQVENYAEYNFLAKDSLSSLKVRAERAMGKKETNNVYICDNGNLIEKVLIFNEKNVKENVDDIKKIQIENNFNVTVSIIPHPFEIMKDELPDNVYHNTIVKLNEYLTDAFSDSEIEYVNSTNIFKRHKDNYLYYRTDPNITTNGAYVLYHDLATALNYTPLASSDFKISDVSRDFLGTNYVKTLKETDPDIIVDYKPLETQRFKVRFPLEGIETDSMYFPSHLSNDDKYPYFLDGSHALTVIESPNKNGRKLAIFKDLHANVVVPFIANHFETIYMIDLSLFDGDAIKYIKENGVEDVLYLYGVNTFIGEDIVK